METFFVWPQSTVGLGVGMVGYLIGQNILIISTHTTPQITSLTLQRLNWWTESERSTFNNDSLIFSSPPVSTAREYDWIVFIQYTNINRMYLTHWTLFYRQIWRLVFPYYFDQQALKNHSHGTTKSLFNWNHSTDWLNGTWNRVSTVNTIEPATVPLKCGNLALCIPALLCGCWERRKT